MAEKVEPKDGVRKGLLIAAARKGINKPESEVMPSDAKRIREPVTQPSEDSAKPLAAPTGPWPYVTEDSAKPLAAYVAKLEADKIKWFRAWTEQGKKLFDAQATIAKLREALKECADDLAWEIEHTYEGTLQYPSMRRKRERDMAPVDKARKLLGEQK